MESPPAKRRRLEGDLVSTIEIEIVEPLITQEGELWLIRAGIASLFIKASSSRDHAIFRRRAIEYVHDFLNTNVAQRDTGGLGWIIGASGAGKSTSTLVYMLQLDRKKCTSTWIASGGSRFIRIEGNKMIIADWKKKAKLTDWLTCLDMIDGTKKHFVFMDGLTSRVGHMRLRGIMLWAVPDVCNRKIVVSSSLAMLAMFSSKTAPDLKWHVVTSWSAEEYTAAAECRKLYASIEKYLDVDAEKYYEQAFGLTSKQKIKMKFSYAGGNARWMLSRDTKSIVDSYASLESLFSESILHRLFNIYHTASKGVKLSIVSDYARYSINGESAENLQHLNALANTNPAVRGFVYEYTLGEAMSRSDISLAIRSTTIVGRQNLAHRLFKERLPEPTASMIPRGRTATEGEGPHPSERKGSNMTNLKHIRTLSTSS